MKTVKQYFVNLDHGTLCSPQPGCDQAVVKAEELEQVVAERDALRLEAGTMNETFGMQEDKIDALQQRLTAADERVDVLEGLLLQCTPSKATHCRECGGDSLTWQAVNTNRSGVQEGRLRTHEVTCVFVIGCDDCSETLATVGADSIAAYLPIAALNPAEGGGDDWNDRIEKLGSAFLE